MIKEGGHFKLMPVVPFVLVQIIIKIHPARPACQPASQPAYTNMNYDHEGPFKRDVTPKC